ncbi:MAG TPA: feruloyl-CoA synthase [Zeimonas sp.]
MSNGSSLRGGTASAAPRYRPLQFGVTRVVVDERADGSRIVRAEQPLDGYPARLSDRLLDAARAFPDRVFVARRRALDDGRRGDWETVTYGQTLALARAIAQALIDRGLDAERPVAILSENGIEHALLGLGCLLAGIPWCPVSPAYSLMSRDFGKLRHVMSTLTPGLVFTADAARYRPALDAVVPEGVEIVTPECGIGTLGGRQATSFEALVSTSPGAAVDAAIAATGPDTIAKFLFTSGSTREPKAVINTHRMWCANQQQMLQSMPVLGAEPPVLVDWLPWNHTFGGNHNFGLVLYNGGTLYIDDGRPTPAAIGETLRNLREIAPTVYFNVPLGFEAIAHAMKDDAVLRRTLLSRVRMFFYAGAALGQPVWDALHEVQEREIGERIVMGTGLGMTESSPFALFITSPQVRAGDLGVPAAGVELKLARCADKIEARYRGPNVTPGYWRAPKETREAFDEEGFFRTGDAVQWIDDNDRHKGLRFDGRVAEDFKLSSGTFVSVGPLRARIVALGAPYVQDAVITGLNRNDVGALVFPTPRVRELAGLAPEAPLEEVLASTPVVERFRALLDALDAQATGSATRVARLLLPAEAPSIDSGEITDKGSINQRAVLRRRDGLVQALHDETHPAILKPRSRR